jgi:hypothetical protein
MAEKSWKHYSQVSVLNQIPAKNNIKEMYHSCWYLLGFEGLCRYRLLF